MKCVFYHSTPVMSEQPTRCQRPMIVFEICIAFFFHLNIITTYIFTSMKKGNTCVQLRYMLMPSLLFYLFHVGVNFKRHGELRQHNILTLYRRETMRKYGFFNLNSRGGLVGLLLLTSSGQLCHLENGTRI